MIYIHKYIRRWTLEGKRGIYANGQHLHNYISINTTPSNLGFYLQESFYLPKE